MNALIAVFLRSLQRHAAWWSGLYFTALTILFTYPLAWRMGDSIVGQVGDNIYFIWLIRWYDKALFTLHTTPFLNAQLNYPEGWNLATSDTVPAVMLYTVPLSWFGGATWAYNVAMLLSFILSGWLVYLWLREITGSEWAGLLAGTLYAFLPNHMAHFLAGHLNLVNMQWFPLYFWALTRLLRADQLAWKPALAAALALGMISGSAPYYIYMTILFSGVFLAAWLWQERSRLRNLALWKNLVLFSGLGTPLTVLPMLPYLLLNLKGGLASRSAEYASSISASPTDFILPSTDHFLFGAWIGAHFDRSLWIEATLYIGAVGGLLALLALLKRKEVSAPYLIAPAVWVIIGSFTLALGVRLLWVNQPVILPVPGPLQGLLGGETTTLPLPGDFLFRYFPLYDKMRALARFGTFAQLWIAALAGLGMAWLLPRLPGGRRYGIALALLALAVLDFYPGPYRQFARIDARPVDYWLAEQPGQGAVAQFPFGQTGDQDQVYNSIIHGKPYIGGYFSANTPPQYQEIRPVLSQFPSPESLTLMKRLGVQYVLVDSSQYADFSTLNAELRAMGLKFGQEVEGQYVYLIP